jgi:DNA-3-methyladenine glycosylase I
VNTRRAAKRRQGNLKQGPKFEKRPQTTKLKRCPWAPTSDPLYLAYHDTEWGVPLHDDRKIFEFLVLEGFQAGLSWAIILRKRENFRKAFDCFDPHKVAKYDEPKVRSLLSDKSVIRNGLKIRSAIRNAQAFLKVQKEFGRFDRYIWGFVGHRPTINRWRHLEELPARTPVSDQLSKDLVSRGFRFVGSTICYAHMQAIGMVNDHVVDCFRHKELGG